VWGVRLAGRGMARQPGPARRRPTWPGRGRSGNRGVPRRAERPAADIISGDRRPPAHLGVAGRRR
jgi:hypothetical protein